MEFAYLVDSHFGEVGSPVPNRTAVAEAFQVNIREAELAEQYGFDGICLAERHARTETFIPSVMIEAAAIAARTERIRIGTTVMQPTYHDPMHLAEQIATLDHLSNGRLDMGFAVGYHPDYFRAFGVPFERRGARFEEVLEVMLRAWTEETVTFDGEFFHYEDAFLTPKPYQEPRPPIWIGGHVEKSVRRSLDLEGWVWGMPLAPLDEAVDMVGRWRQQAAERGNTAWTFHLELEGFIGDDAAEVKTLNAHRWVHEMEYYNRLGLAPDREIEQPSEAEMISQFESRLWLTCGNAQAWIDRIGEVKEQFNPDRLNIRMRTVKTPNGYNPSDEEYFEAIQKFGEEVIPQFK